MPYGLFDYIPESTIHTMGAPGDRKMINGVEHVQCNDGNWDPVRGFIAPCMRDKAPPLQPPSQITTKAMGEECPTMMPPVCPDGSVPRRTGTSKPDSKGCVMPIFAPCPKPPKCAPTYKVGNCNYRLA